jgi:transcription antitermination factor NusG|tara:strand:+ start:219 stop:467 length:249 start_codon:yes stop_codon:yes gene_type:complete
MATKKKMNAGMKALKKSNPEVAKKIGFKNGKVIKAKDGLYANIHAKRARIKAGSGESMRKPGTKGAPTSANFTRAAKTAKKP